jgi:hypothetical protein
VWLSPLSTPTTVVPLVSASEEDGGDVDECEEFCGSGKPATVQIYLPQIPHDPTGIEPRLPLWETGD